MKAYLFLAASALALAAGSTAASAQAVISRSIATEPVETIVTQTPTGTIVTRRPLAPRPNDDERADERRFVRRLLVAAFALQLAGTALGFMLLRRPPRLGGAPPLPTPIEPAHRGATDVRSE